MVLPNYIYPIGIFVRIMWDIITLFEFSLINKIFLIHSTVNMELGGEMESTSVESICMNK